MRKFSSKLAGQQSGFTLIELVIVIVIIGILAAVAIPNFANLSDDANESAAKGIAATISSATAANYAICNGGLGVAGSCKAVGTCASLKTGGLIPDLDLTGISDGAGDTCSITRGATTVLATIKCTSTTAGITCP